MTRSINKTAYNPEHPYLAPISQCVYRCDGHQGILTHRSEATSFADASKRLVHWGVRLRATTGKALLSEKSTMENFPIEGYDLVVLIVVVVATVLGAWKGMAWQVASIASLVVSSVVAMRFCEPIAPLLSRHEPWNRFLAMLVLFLVTSLLIWLLFRWVAHIIDRIHLREFDRQMGALFGLAKGILFCMVLTFFAVTLSQGSRESVLRSHSGYWLAVGVQRVVPAMPETVRSALHEYIEEFQQQLHDVAPPKPGEWLRDREPPDPEGNFTM